MRQPVNLLQQRDLRETEQRSKSVYWLWGLGVIGVLALKLFTYAYYYSDDPTCGVAWRPALSFSSVQWDSPPPASRILIQDENGFIGEDLYRHLTSWGWWLVAGAYISYVIYSKLYIAKQISVI